MSSTPIVVLTHTFATSEPTITSLRGRRSATTPPTSSVATCASVQQAKAMPVSLAEPVRSRTAKATAISARLRPSALLPVALQAGVRLPERHGAVIALVDIPPDSPGELRFRYTVERNPLVQPAAQLVEVARDVVEHAEVDQRQPFRRSAL